ncbi:MAG: 30S ribosomal protein S25e [Nitrososphaerota archaeon]|nr:30S ribosomal protein S25e [Aigarchaeota archaeon]MDW8076027.1 30S ribosomal protein S25e [Nitrososphaerota archaeon]
MGGPKKPTLSQAEKKQVRLQQKPSEKKESAPQKYTGSIAVPEEKDVINYIRSMKYATPYLISEKYGIRLSVAKSLLNSLASKGLLVPVVGDNRLRIFAPAQAIAEPAKASEVAKPSESAETKPKSKKKK